jgi:predicted RNase H-like HicB family nuclease
MQDFSFDTHIFREDDAYVAYVPVLDISSCGETDEEARRNIRDAVRGFLAASADMGTLGEILEEAGYRREGDDWRAPEFVSLDRLTMSLKQANARYPADTLPLTGSCV